MWLNTLGLTKRGSSLMNTISQPHGPVSVEDRLEMRSFRRNVIDHKFVLISTCLIILSFFGILTITAIVIPSNREVVFWIFVCIATLFRALLIIWGIVTLICVSNVVGTYVSRYFAHMIAMIPSPFKKKDSTLTS